MIKLLKFIHSEAPSLYRTSTVVNYDNK